MPSRPSPYCTLLASAWAGRALSQPGDESRHADRRRIGVLPDGHRSKSLPIGHLQGRGRATGNGTVYAGLGDLKRWELWPARATWSVGEQLSQGIDSREPR